MNFLNLVFYVFIPVFLVTYYFIPTKYRYIAIFVGSYIFYGYANPNMLLVLIGATLISYVGGLIIEKKHSKTALVVSFMAEIMILTIFKYTNFAVDNYNLIMSRISPGVCLNIDWNIVLPVGLSFIVFQTCTYLTDVWRENIKAEKNIIRYGAFVAFFPTVLSGPIQKARNLLPQLSNPKAFDYEQAKKGTILFVWGLFEKIVVANNLSAISTRVLGDFENYSSATILIGAVSFSLYIYADFSSYSDMARGISKLMGIDVGKNFNNPYLSKSTAEFWNRWHMSLNDWFIENLYIPLGGNRKGKIRKYINMLIVFLVSGLWHGANWHFVAWGVINGAFVVIGQMLRPAKIWLYKKLGVDENVESIVFLKRATVFYLITLTWVFFNKGIIDALQICKKIILFDFISIFDSELLNIGGSAVITFFTVLFAIVFCVVQCKRQEESKVYKMYDRQPVFMQCLLIAILICVCVFRVCSTDANVNTQFLYFQF